jgi:hypothetical protein
MEPYGKIYDISIIKDKVTGLSKGTEHTHTQPTNMGHCTGVAYFIIRTALTRCFLRGFLHLIREHESTGCAFVTFNKRKEAVKAMAAVHGVHTVPGISLSTARRSKLYSHRQLQFLCSYHRALIFSVAEFL